MSRLRIQLSKSDIDRKVATAMESAERLILSTLRSCEVYMRTTENPQESRRARIVVRDLKRALGSVTGVRRVSSIYDAGDPDLEVDPAPKLRPAASPIAAPVRAPEST
jgi:hypothetical protein